MTVQIKEVVTRICPQCGSNHLKRTIPYWDDQFSDFEDIGIFLHYDRRAELCKGDYTCINGHQFRIDEEGIINQ